MKFQNTILLAALMGATLSANAAIELQWSATANETKTLYSIAGSGYTINWGDGTTDSNSSHTYTTAGTYTASISGTVTTLDLRGDGSTAATGITGLKVTESDQNLTTLYIWGNSNLTELDIIPASKLQELNATATSLTSLDLSGNTALTALDVKSSSGLTTLTTANSYPKLTSVDINNTGLSACSMNALYNALPTTTTGVIYALNATGDATSNPKIATAKGWTFSNGGTGDSSAVCLADLEAVTDVKANANSANNYSISWSEAEGAYSYSIRLVSKEDQGLCNSTYIYTSSTSVTTTIDTAATPTYYVYSIRDNEYEVAGPFSFSSASSGVSNIGSTNNEFVYCTEGQITIKNVGKGQIVKIYNLQGELIGEQKANGDVHFKENTGTYLVTTPMHTYKVIVVK